MKTKDLLFLRTLQGWLILLFVLMSGFFLQGFAQTIVVTNPASPWTVPSCVTSIKVEVWGGGGGGGGALGYFLASGAGGGGGGGAYKAVNLTVSSGQTYTITIGAGGTAGGSGAAGGTGGVTTVSGTGGTVSVNGGIGGGGGNYGNGTSGAGGTGGTFSGGAGGASSGNGAGGGGGAGNNSDGGAGGNSATGIGGTGNPNNAPYIGGNGGAYISSNGTGNAGSAPGGGGGGGRYSGLGGSNNGGSGGAGQVVITYTQYTPPAAPTVTSPVDYCINSTVNQLTATGSNLLWYTAATGGTGSSTAPTPLTTAAGTTSYYVSQTVGCEGARAQIDVVVHASPSTLVTGKTDITCNGANNGTITVSASGGTTPYQFSIDNGTNYIAGSSPYTFNGLSAGVQYKIRVKDNYGCTSPIIP